MQGRGRAVVAEDALRHFLGRKCATTSLADDRIARHRRESAGGLGG